MNAEIVKKRIRTVRTLLKKKKVNFFLITKAANVTYTTGFLGEDSWAVITPKAVYLLTDSRYIEQAEKECFGCKLILRRETLHDTVAELVKKLKFVRTVAIEDHTALKDFKLLQKKLSARLRTISKIVEPSRSIKDKSELAAIKKCIQIAAKALSQTLKNLRPGMTENEATGMLNYNLRKFGGRDGFDTILAFGPNGSRCHHQPGSRKLRENDTILIDFGAEYNHYRCDITRCFLAGRQNPLFERAYKAVKEAQAAAIKAIRPGLANKEPEKIAREIIRKHNLPPYQHGTGHGFGLEIHEDPFLAIKSKEKLRAGMVLTVEPGIYIPGKLGVRIEDNVLITKTGCKVLTNAITKDYNKICLGRLKR